MSIKFKVAKINLNSTEEKDPDELMRELTGRLEELKASLPSFSYKMERQGDYLKVISLDLEEHVN